MRGGTRHFLLELAAALLLGALAVGHSGAQEAVYDVDEVKAAFLYRFGTYVVWPSPRSAEPLTIAVLGDESVAAHLAAFLPGRRIEDRSVEVRILTRIEELAGDEIVFIGRSSNARLPEVIAAIGMKPVLVVTDAPNGLESGGMVNFQQVDSRLRFEISVPRAEEAGLTLSSRLLAAAFRVVTSHCCAVYDVHVAAVFTK